MSEIPATSVSGIRSSDVYEFGEFKLDPWRRVLYRDDDHVALTPKVFDTLLALVEEAGRVVRKEDLLARVWPDTIVEEGSLANTISSLRKVLGSGAIATVPRLGYRFAESIRLCSAAAEIATRSPALAPPRSRTPYVIAVVGAAAIAAMTAIFLTRHRPLAFEHIREDVLINDAGVGSSGVSPDGRFVGLIMHSGQQEGLMLFNVATKSMMPLLPPSPLQLQDVRFSRDGNSLYFRRHVDANGDGFALFRLPILGGNAVRLADNVNSQLTFAPDGTTFAFLRWNKGNTDVVVVRAGRERVLATTPYLGEYPSWSPDGSAIVMTRPEGPGLDIVNAKTGEVRPFAGTPRMRSPVWISDGKGLLFRFDDPDAHHRQVGFVTYPKGEFRRISSDANHYDSALTMTADGQRVVCTVDRDSNRISIVSLTSASSESEIAGGTLVDGIQWTANGILASVDGRLVRMSTNGASEDLVDESTFKVKQPRTCGGRGVVYRHDSSGRRSSIEWVSSDGAQRRALTGEIDAKYPVCSPDGSVFYDDHAQIFEATPNSGSSRRLIPVPLSYQGGFEFSPDFKSVLVTASHATKLPQEHSWKWIDLKTLRRIREFSPIAASQGLVRFAPDGNAFAYIVESGGVDNLYLQPVEGTAGHFITSFQNRDAINDFAIAPDGRSAVLVRAHRSADLVMMRQIAQ